MRIWTNFACTSAVLYPLVQWLGKRKAHFRSFCLASALILLRTAHAQPAYAYIPNYQDNTVSVINTITDTVVETIRVGSVPLGVAITPDGSKAYITNNGDPSVSVINTGANTVAITITTNSSSNPPPPGYLSSPRGIAITPDGTRVYVANASNGILVIDTLTNSVVAAFPTGCDAYDVAITPDDTQAYVTNNCDNTVSVVNIASNPNKIVATISVGRSPQGVDIAPDDKHAYVANWADSTVSVIDTTTHSVTTIAGFANPVTVAVAPDGSRAYVVGGYDGIMLINTTDNTVTDTNVSSPLVLHRTLGVAFTQNGAKAYVPTSCCVGPNPVYVFNTANVSLLTTVAVGYDLGAPLILGKFVGPEITMPASQGVPTINQTNGVVSGASFQAGIAANSWITILGVSLSAVTDTWANAVVNGNLPTSLDGVSVSAGGQSAYISYVSPTQINALVPNVGAGMIPVTVTNANGTSAKFLATVQLTEPGFFQWGNYAVATRTDYSLAVKNGTFQGITTTPAKPGDVIILWGTGFGPTSPSAPVGVEVPDNSTYNAANSVIVAVGGIPATVYGAALAPGIRGAVPSGDPDSDLAP
jgi:uncharacterized protein (TIGR03437 family)